eukprot:GGOE01005796.1.p1 GENE.GGOE01005796.1~~GGOE01005796.1.p1  ORF type:complete len:448 (-),score=89.00 GGOE01005796.1:161-1504(-)
MLSCWSCAWPWKKPLHSASGTHHTDEILQQDSITIGIEEPGVCKLPDHVDCKNFLVFEYLLNGCWTPYSKEDNVALNVHYCKAPDVPLLINIQFQDYISQCTVDLTRLIQTHAATGIRQRVRRTRPQPLCHHWKYWLDEEWRPFTAPECDVMDCHFELAPHLPLFSNSLRSPSPGSVYRVDFLRMVHTDISTLVQLPIKRSFQPSEEIEIFSAEERREKVQQLVQILARKPTDLRPLRAIQALAVDFPLVTHLTCPFCNRAEVLARLIDFIPEARDYCRLADEIGPLHSEEKSQLVAKAQELSPNDPMVLCCTAELMENEDVRTALEIQVLRQCGFEMLHPFLHFLAKRDPLPEHKVDLLHVVHLIGPRTELWLGDADEQCCVFFPETELWYEGNYKAYFRNVLGVAAGQLAGLLEDGEVVNVSGQLLDAKALEIHARAMFQIRNEP